MFVEERRQEGEGEAWHGMASLGLFWPVSKANGAYRHQRRGVTQNTEGDNDKSPARSDRSGSYGIRGKVRKGLTRVHSARVGLLK